MCTCLCFLNARQGISEFDSVGNREGFHSRRLWTERKTAVGRNRWAMIRATSWALGKRQFFWQAYTFGEQQITIPNCWQLSEGNIKLAKWYIGSTTALCCCWKKKYWKKWCNWRKAKTRKGRKKHFIPKQKKECEENKALQIGNHR